jgi:hypothetical protein
MLQLGTTTGVITEIKLEKKVQYYCNTTLLASGRNLDEAYNTLKDMMECTNGVFNGPVPLTPPLK